VSSLCVVCYVVGAGAAAVQGAPEQHLHQAPGLHGAVPHGGQLQQGQPTLTHIPGHWFLTTNY